MPAKAPDGFRRCRICDKFLPISEFGNGNYKNALCYPHWRSYQRERGAKWSAAHPGYDAARKARWQSENPEKARQSRQRSNKKWTASGKARAWKRDDAKKYPDRYRAYWRSSGKRWRSENPEKARASSMRKRMARKKGVGQVRAADLVRILETFSGQCVYCSAPATTWDHIVAVSRGGSNFPWNLAPACKPCNSRKLATPVEDFIRLCTPLPIAVPYLLDAVQKSTTLVGDLYARNLYEKVSTDSLLDDLRRLQSTFGRVTVAVIDVYGKFHASTYIRRFGSMKAARDASGVLGP